MSGTLPMDSAAHRASAAILLDEPGEFAPIALFAYNRPAHTQETLATLRRNDLAPQSDLFIFCDGPKNEADVARVQEVRRCIHGVDGFRSVKAIEREGNLGLANSVITGVTQLCQEYGRAIAVEDDLVTTRDFLTFLNRALIRYKNESRVLSVSGFNFALEPPQDYGYDAFYSYRSSSWGWGTWNDRWKRVDWNVSDYADFCSDNNQQRLFRRGGDDLMGMLTMQMSGQIDSWAIRWSYAHFKNNGVAVLPTASKVYNIGLDGSGTHCSYNSARQTVLVAGSDQNYRFPDASEPDPYFVAEVRRKCRRSLPRRLVDYCRSQLKRAGILTYRR
jgi:hypothetical protein